MVHAQRDHEPVAPETDDEVGEQRVSRRDIVDKRQHAKKLQLLCK